MGSNLMHLASECEQLIFLWVMICVVLYSVVLFRAVLVVFC